MEDIILSETSLDPEDPDALKKTEAYCVEKVETLLEKAGWCRYKFLALKY